VVAPRSPAAEGAASQPPVAAAEPAGPLPGALADVRAPGSLKEAVAAPRVGRAAAGPRASAVPGRLVPSSLPEGVAVLERPRVVCALGPAAAPHWALPLEAPRAVGQAPERRQPAVPAARLRWEQHPEPEGVRRRWAPAGCGPRRVACSPERRAVSAGWKHPRQAGPPLVLPPGRAAGRARQVRAKREVRRARLRWRCLLAHRAGLAAGGLLVLGPAALLAHRLVPGPVALLARQVGRVADGSLVLARAGLLLRPARRVGLVAGGSLVRGPAALPAHRLVPGPAALLARQVGRAADGPLVLAPAALLARAGLLLGPARLAGHAAATSRSGLRSAPAAGPAPLVQAGHAGQEVH